MQYHSKTRVVYLRVLIITLIVRVIFGRVNRLELFRCECERFAAVLDHLAHFADAFGALRLALMAGEDVARPAGARLDRLGHIALAKAVAVADVHESSTRSTD